MHFSAKRGIAIACRLSATGRPIHFMFGYRVGIISNGHISATAHDLLI